MSEKKANHVCKNRKCPHGINGEPKHYWACNDCDRTGSWRAVACSPGCFQKYVADVEEMRQARPVSEKAIEVAVDSDTIEGKAPEIEPETVADTTGAGLPDARQNVPCNTKKRNRK